MLRNLKKVQFLKNVSKKSSGTNPILVRNDMKSCKNGFQIKDMGKSPCKKLRNVFLNVFYRMVLLKTPLNDVFCMEMPISRKKNTEKNHFFIYFRRGFTFVYVFLIKFKRTFMKCV